MFQLRGPSASARLGMTSKTPHQQNYCHAILSRPTLPAMRNILLIILILLLIGAFPGWGYSSGWGYYPFGGIGLILLIVLILALTGKL